MKAKEKLYFRYKDSISCEPIEGLLQDAKSDGLTEITLIEAVPDNNTSDYIWCHIYDAVSRCDCSKALCSRYESKSGRGKCENKGKLYYNGKTVTFKV